jgi:hypothetical protein
MTAPELIKLRPTRRSIRAVPKHSARRYPIDKKALI